MFSVQNEHKPKSRMKLINDEASYGGQKSDNKNLHQTSNGPSNDYTNNRSEHLNDHRSTSKQPTDNGVSSDLSDLTDLGSRTNSLFDYASSGQSSNNKMIVSKAMQKAQDYKAKVVQFYMNGDPFRAQFRVTIMRNRDFPTFNKLLDHLTERTKLPIKFVFDADGKRLTDVDQFEHSNIYICSTTNKFYNAEYGSRALKSNFRTTNFADIRPFLRPLSSKNKYNKYNNNRSFNNSMNTNSYNSSDSSLEGKSLNGVVKKAMPSKTYENEENSLSDSSRKSVGGKFIKGKVVTIINRKLPLKSSRVLLNLRSARTFEHVVKDLGESVSLPMARILLTPFGNEVRSISQLRRSLNEIDTFFVDDLQLETIEDWNKRNSTKSNLDNLGPPKSQTNELTEKDELIERLSLAAGSSEELNKNNVTSTTSTEKGTNKERKIVVVTPVCNQSLNKQLNIEQFDTISIDSFDTLPDILPENQQLIPTSNTHVHNLPVNNLPVHNLPIHNLPIHNLPIHNLPIHNLSAHNSSVHNTPAHNSVHPSFLLSGFTVEFKNRNETKTNDKQIQVDINYLPIESYPRVDEKFHVDLASKNAGKFRDIDAQVPTFYVLDDVFGDHFKRRSMIKRTNRREVLFRSDANLSSRKAGKSNNKTAEQKASSKQGNRNSESNSNSETNSRNDNATKARSRNDNDTTNKTHSPNDNLTNKTRSRTNSPTNEPTVNDLNNNDLLANNFEDQNDKSTVNDVAERDNKTPELYSTNRLPSTEPNNYQLKEPAKRTPMPSSNSQSNNQSNSQSNKAAIDLNESSSPNQLNQFSQTNQRSQMNNLTANQRSRTRQTSQLSKLNQTNQHSSATNSAIKQSKFYESRLINGVKVPQKRMRLKRIFGYNGGAIGNNLFVLATGEIAYYVGIFVVLFDPYQNAQRFYFEHTEDVCCMNVDHKSQLMVSIQKGNTQENRLPVLKIWNFINLETLFSFQNFENCSANILSVTVSKSSFLLVLVLLNNSVQLYYLDWKSNRLITKAQKLLKNEEIYGLVFHPDSDTHFISFGKRHLILWMLENNELNSKKTFKHVIKGAGSCITCLTFLDGGYLMACDSDGLILVWSPVENEICEFNSSINEIKAHDASISSILAFPNRYVVTGDISGVLKTWTFDRSQFNLLNVATLPALSGEIRSLSFGNELLSTDPEYFLNNTDNEKLYKIYIGTTTNMIFSGSALQATQYIILYEGHSFGIHAIAVDSVEKYFYTAGIDHKICKWSKNLLLWCVRCKYQCTSMAVYPAGESLAVGCTNGIICILSTTSSEFITQISLSNSSIGCLAYSPDNLLLAAGTENGVLHILPVFDNGSSYDRISAFKCNYPILSLQWSLDCKHILTSINDNEFHETLLWDLISSNFVKGESVMNEQITWYDATCISGDDVKGIWENDNLDHVANLCCHCSSDGQLLVAGDENGYVRLFQYPCVEEKASFHLAKQSSNAVTEVRFLKDNSCMVASSTEGFLFIWDLL